MAPAQTVATSSKSQRLGMDRLRKRRHLTPEFKARIAIGALQGVKTINEIAQANELAKVDEAWCPDITYIPMALIVIMDY